MHGSCLAVAFSIHDPRSTTPDPRPPTHDPRPTGPRSPTCCTYSPCQNLAVPGKIALAPYPKALSIRDQTGPSFAIVTHCWGPPVFVPTRDRHRLGWLARVHLVVAAAGLGGVLGLARVHWSPTRAGTGRTAQLPGLRPCAFAAVTGRFALRRAAHDHGLRLVRARADRSIVGSESGREPVRGAVNPIDRLAAGVRCTGRAGGSPIPLGPFDGPAPGGCRAEPSRPG